MLRRDEKLGAHPGFGMHGIDVKTVGERLPWWSSGWHCLPVGGGGGGVGSTLELRSHIP